MGIILPLHCRSIICCASAVYIFIIWASSSVGLSHPGLFFFGIKIGSPSSNVDLRDHYPFASRRCRSSSRSRASGYTAKFKTKLVVADMLRLSFGFADSAAWTYAGRLHTQITVSTFTLPEEVSSTYRRFATSPNFVPVLLALEFRSSLESPFQELPPTYHEP
jgi:hypothetical protein